LAVQIAATLMHTPVIRPLPVMAAGPSLSWRERNGGAILLDTTAFPRYLWVMDKVAEELGCINKTLAEIRDLLRSPNMEINQRP